MNKRLEEIKRNCRMAAIKFEEAKRASPVPVAWNLNYVVSNPFAQVEGPSCPNNKKEQDMYAQANVASAAVSTPPSEIATQRKFLNSRLLNAINEKCTDLRKVFYLDGDVYPKTPKELKDRLASGKFIVVDSHGEPVTDDSEYRNERMYGISDYIRWQDPATPPDRKGYDEAVKKVETAADEARETIEIFSAEEGLKAVNAFKAKKFH